MKPLSNCFLHLLPPPPPSYLPICFSLFDTDLKLGHITRFTGELSLEENIATTWLLTKACQLVVFARRMSESHGALDEG